MDLTGCMDRQKWTPITPCRLPAHPARLRGPQIPGSQHSQACRNVNNNGGSRINCAWSLFPALAQENVWRLPHWISFLQACECWEGKRFLTTVLLGAQRRGTTVEIGARCLGLPDPGIILTVVHTTSKLCQDAGFRNLYYLHPIPASFRPKAVVWKSSWS